MTRVAGIVGGIGNESTIDDDRSLLTRYRERTGGPNNPPVIIHSIDSRRMLDADAFARSGEPAAFSEGVPGSGPS